MQFFKNLSFRKKVFLSQLVLFILFIGLLYPLIGRSVGQIIRNSLEETTKDLIHLLQKAPDVEGMIKILDSQENVSFYRISLINDKEQLLYDSHLMDHLGEKFVPLTPTQYEEVKEALHTGSGYAEEYSPTFSQNLIYVATAFTFHGQKFVMRAAFPVSQVDALTHNFEVGFLAVGGSILLFFTLMTWVIFFRMSIPIQRIINAVRPFQQNPVEILPTIPLDKSLGKDDEFNRLAQTLNTLSEKVRMQLQDITEERNEKEAILESLAEGVIAVDAHNLVTYINHTGTKMLSISKKDLLGSPFNRVSFPLIERCKALLHKCQEEKHIITDSIFLEEPEKLYLDLIAAPKLEGHGAIVVIQDKSSQHKVLEMGKSFIANASHELRTPITIIRGFAETLQDMPDLPREMLSGMVEKIVRNCQRMESLVKNLLTLADIENIPETHFQPTDLVFLLDNCKHLLLSVHPEIFIEVENDQERISILADGDLLELAIINLLENAVKYSLPPAHITVRIKELQESVEIEIKDKGIGIPAEDVDHIFERFYTVDKARSRRLGGAGLGLSIVKTIIQKHAGSIAVASEVKVGTTFTITLPKERNVL